MPSNLKQRMFSSMAATSGNGIDAGVPRHDDGGPTSPLAQLVDLTCGPTSPSSPSSPGGPYGVRDKVHTEHSFSFCSCVDTSLQKKRPSRAHRRSVFRGHSSRTMCVDWTRERRNVVLCCLLTHDALYFFYGTRRLGRDGAHPCHLPPCLRPISFFSRPAPDLSRAERSPPFPRAVSVYSEFLGLRVKHVGLPVTFGHRVASILF